MTPLPAVSQVNWPKTWRIVRSAFPPIDLFEDIADPADWALLATAEARTNPRVLEAAGRMDLVSVARSVGGPGSSNVMAPFVHVSRDRPSRFSTGDFGIYYAGDRVEVALFETIHHHGRFMSQTQEPAGWSSQFRELVGSVNAELHDIRSDANFMDCLHPDDYSASGQLGQALHAVGSDGIVYPSVRYPQGNCIGAFWPDVVTVPYQRHHYVYHWNTSRVDFVRNLTTGVTFRVEDADE